MRTVCGSRNCTGIGAESATCSEISLSFISKIISVNTWHCTFVGYDGELFAMDVGIARIYDASRFRYIQMLILPCVLGLSVFFYGLWAMKHDVPTSVR